METEKKYFAGWWIWVVILLIFTIIALSGLKYAGILGTTIVERKVFEQSYQRSEALISEIATYEAQLAEINSKLSGELDKATRSNFEAQASSIRILLTVARSKQ